MVLPAPSTWLHVHAHTDILTSTENFFPKVNKKGCMSMSGSFRKQLGLEWCRECKRVHHLADAPCLCEEQSMIATVFSLPNSDYFPFFTQCWTLSLERTHFCRKIIKSRTFFCGQLLTIKWHITNLCSRWFHFVFLKTERCPKSCCNHEAWTWKREKEGLGVTQKKNKDQNNEIAIIYFEISRSISWTLLQSHSQEGTMKSWYS